MKPLAVIFMAAAIVLAGCASTSTQNSASGDKDSVASLRAEVRAIKAELQDVRTDVQALRVTLIALQDKITTGGVTSDGTTTSKLARQWFDKVSKYSDVVRVWMGELNGVQFYICPVTKADQTQVLRDELGDDYTYMWLTIINNNAKQAYKFEPKIALFKLEFEGDTPADKPKFVPSFDPREVIKVRKMQLGEIALEDHFKERELLPGESLETHILFPKSVDFSKVKALYMNTVLIPELKQQ